MKLHRLGSARFNSSLLGDRWWRGVGQDASSLSQDQGVPTCEGSFGAAMASTHYWGVSKSALFLFSWLHCSSFVGQARKKRAHHHAERRLAVGGCGSRGLPCPPAPIWQLVLLSYAQPTTTSLYYLMNVTSKLTIYLFTHSFPPRTLTTPPSNTTAP